MIIHIDINGTCQSISNATNNLLYCDQNNTPFLLLLIPNILQGLSIFLVFMTALEFICAQAPLRLKGLLIGLWYSLLATNYLVVEVPELFTVSSLSWTIFHSVKAFAIFLSLMIYMWVSNRYQYRLRDEVVNERFLVEEIYERELNLAEEYERANAAECVDLSDESNESHESRCGAIYNIIKKLTKYYLADKYFLSERLCCKQWKVDSSLYSHCCWYEY